MLQAGSSDSVALITAQLLQYIPIPGHTFQTYYENGMFTLAVLQILISAILTKTCTTTQSGKL